MLFTEAAFLEIGITLAALATIVSALESSTLRLNGKAYLKIRFTTVENCLVKEPVL